MRLSRLILRTLLLVSLPVFLGAQARTSFALDASVNLGVGKGGEFKDDDYGSVRVAASVARGVSKKIGMFAELAVDPLALSDGSSLVCLPSSRGGCAPPFPSFTAASLLIGAMSSRDRWFEVRAGIGGAIAAEHNTRVGGIVTQADVGLFPMRHLGLVLGWRAIVIPRFRHDKLTLGSAVVGLRIR
jgi:hypothetical protein